MKKVSKKIKSPVPLFACAGIWVLWALFLPMYALWHFAILAVISAGVGYLFSRKFRPKEFEYEVEVPSDTGVPDVDALIDGGRAQLRQLRTLNEKIADEKITAQINEMENFSARIFDRLAEDHDKVKQVRRFMNYYLPTTVELLSSYERLSREHGVGENVRISMEKIEGVLDTIVTAFRKQLDGLFAEEAMDISADITVLEGIIKSEGLTEGHGQL